MTFSNNFLLPGNNKKRKMDVNTGMNHWPTAEQMKILNVLERDRKLRSLEEMRLRQMKQELSYLRKKGALKPGLDAGRSCARCVNELGRIINRGALCRLCLKKVCKTCRQYGEDDSGWICVFCSKQMYLKAISGEWMQDLSSYPSRKQMQMPPGDELLKTLHELQKTGLMFESKQHENAQLLGTSVTKALDEVSSNQISKKHVQGDVTSNDAHSEDSKSSVAQHEDLNIHKGECFERVNPWSGIEAEPTIPVRVLKAVPLGLTIHPECADAPLLRERQSSDDGHSTMSIRSQSTSSEVLDNNEASAVLSTMHSSSIKNQQAGSDCITLQNSSVDTTDSGVCSPVLKCDAVENTAVHSSPKLDFKKQVSNKTEKTPMPSMKHSCESSFSESDDDFSKSGIVFRKVTLKKKKSVAESALMHEKTPENSADESGNSLRSSPHGRLRVRSRTLSGEGEDGKHKKGPIPQISVSECLEQSLIGQGNAGSSERDSVGTQDDDLDQVFTYHSRSQMSLSSFGARSESMTSVYSAAGGGRYGTVTVTGEVLFGLNYNYKAGTLEVHIKECRNLAPVDTKRSRSDPYAKVYLLPDRTKSGKRKTKVKKHTLSPVFDELLRFQVTISELEARTLWLSVWHSDMFGRNDFLGEVMLPLGYDTFETAGLKWYPLQERLETIDTPVSYKGDLILALKYVPPDVTNRKHHKKPGDQNKGALHVLVKEARNLMATRSNGTSDPFCKSYLLPDKSKSGKQKTSVLKKSCSPKWNHTFVYEDVTLAELRERCLELTIWDYDKITSNDFLGGVRLSLGSGKYQGRDVDWMDSVGEEVSLWYTMLDRPNMWVDGSLLLRPTMQNRRA